MFNGYDFLGQLQDLCPAILVVKEVIDSFACSNFCKGFKGGDYMIIKFPNFKFSIALCGIAYLE